MSASPIANRIPTLPRVAAVTSLAAALAIGLVAVYNYVEQYVYDAVGNILTMSHAAGVGSWTRAYQIAATSNQAIGTTLHEAIDYYAIFYGKVLI